MRQRPDPTSLIFQNVYQKVTQTYPGCVSIPVYAVRLVTNQVVLQALLSRSKGTQRNHNLLPVKAPIRLLKVTKHQH
jgi:hypothetical protein